MSSSDENDIIVKDDLGVENYEMDEDDDDSEMEIKDKNEDSEVELDSMSELSGKLTITVRELFTIVLFFARYKISFLFFSLGK
jgi:phosphopantothenoylcysteine synthetase/decarboxylase